MEITLTPDLEIALDQYARRKGIPLQTLVIETLRERFGSAQATEPPASVNETLLDYLSDHIGVLSSSEYIPKGARMSENGRKKFAASLVKKRQRGKL